MDIMVVVKSNRCYQRTGLAS